MSYLQVVGGEYLTLTLEGSTLFDVHILFRLYLGKLFCFLIG
ncbi:hypothetical protein [Peribacillus asahii]